MFLYGHQSFQYNAPFWAICHFVTAGHNVVKLPYIGLLPQTQLREVASCTVLAEALPRQQDLQRVVMISGCICYQCSLS